MPRGKFGTPGFGGHRERDGEHRPTGGGALKLSCHVIHDSQSAGEMEASINTLPSTVDADFSKSVYIGNILTF